MTEEQPAPARAEGVIVRQEINGGTKVFRIADNGRWNDEAERRFLEELAATCNVCAAAEAAGFSTTAVYNRRMRHPGFAAEWLAAVEQGYARLEAMLVEKASDSLRSAPISGDAPGREIPFAQALNLLRLHRAEVRGGKPQDYRAAEKAPDWDEVSESILRKMDAFDRAEAWKAAQTSA